MQIPADFSNSVECAYIECEKRKRELLILKKVENMRPICCGSKKLRHIKCDNCGTTMGYVKTRGVTQIICCNCRNLINLPIHKY